MGYVEVGETANCPACGRKGHGLIGVVLTRTCVVCGRSGCDRCLSLHYVINSKPVKGSVSDNLIGYVQNGCCSPSCYQTYWERVVKHNPWHVLDIPILPLYRPEFYAAHVIAITHRSGQPTSEDIQVLGHYIENPLAQGITMMYEGYKSLDFGKITDGLRICRGDPTYHTYAKEWVDNLAVFYINDLKRFDIPTNQANMGGVSISLTMPKNQSQMKLHSCPSCGAQMEQMAVRGQTVKCSFCSSTFEIT